MLRRLLVMRHAKSSWKEPGQADHARPLNGRGQRDAPRMGAYLAASGWAPELVLSSDSQRTRETWALASEALEPEPEVRFLPELYLAGPEVVRRVLSGVDDSVETLLILGHNDGWEEVVGWLCGRGERITTGNIAFLSTEAPSWSAALAQAPRWRLHEVARPKELPEGF